LYDVILSRPPFTGRDVSWGGKGMPHHLTATHSDNFITLAPL
jgi:hypothetical protein